MNPWNLIPWSISLVALVYAILTYVKNNKKDTKAEYRETDERFDGLKESLLKVNLKLDQVCATTNETRTDIKSLNKDLADVDRRLSVMERDIQTAFMRIDELREKIG